MNIKIRQTALAFLLLFSLPAPTYAAPNAGGDGQEIIILNQGTNEIIHNGVKVLAAQPHAVKKGVTYVAAKSIIKELYGTIAYDAATKYYVMRSGATAIGFAVNQTNYRLNGVTKAGLGAAYIDKGTLMVPLKTVATTLGIDVKNVPEAKRVELVWSMKPIAKFSVSDTTPYAMQTEVAYKDEAYHPRGYEIIDEKWENRYETFEHEGSYAITHWVQDVNGVWSDPYTVVVNVKPSNKPPVASFTTTKDTYKMGEYIGYFDNSTDDENGIVSRVWTNNLNGFFEPGQQTITLRVTDVHGETSEYAKTITILDDTLYERGQFDLLYAPIGSKFAINGADVLKYRSLSAMFDDSEQMTLIRENSPETFSDEGIFYEADDLSGNVRFMLHNHSKMSKPVKAYIIATNTSNAPATATMGPIGIGGPHSFVYVAGKAAAGNYLASRLSYKSSLTTIPAGESRLIFPEVSDKIIKPGDVYSLYADANFDRSVKVQVVILDASKNVFEELPNLRVLKSDGHVRGTYEHANRYIEVNEPLGQMKTRMLFGDGYVDPRLYGLDQTIGFPSYNEGNYGVVYTIKLNNVQPNTMIAINPRGGFYAGAFTVNGKVVYTTSNTVLSNYNEASVLYRTGFRVESVTITFTPASGSNLPINLLFMPFR
ncbi:stalk domain-containing protein [Cohnella yongneupensis]|uniref:Stalk domain-containing protein n=1 Tax=Cohnella yongneupensis TaxID=425006 RepID=A0ABW0R4U5_9BACL